MRRLLLASLLVAAAPAFGYNEPPTGVPDCRGTGVSLTYNATTGTLSCTPHMSNARALASNGAAAFYSFVGIKSPRDRMLHH